MVEITTDYLEKLDPIYRDVFCAFWMFNPNGRPDWGVAAQSLYAAMEKNNHKYTLGQIREACDQLVRGKAMKLEKDIFYHPTELGKAIIAAVQSRYSTTTTPPPFSPPPGF